MTDDTAPASVWSSCDERVRQATRLHRAGRVALVGNVALSFARRDPPALAQIFSMVRAARGTSARAARRRVRRGARRSTGARLQFYERGPFGVLLSWGEGQDRDARGTPRMLLPADARHSASGSCSARPGQGQCRARCNRCRRAELGARYRANPRRPSPTVTTRNGTAAATPPEPTRSPASLASVTRLGSRGRRSRESVPSCAVLIP